MVITLTQRLVGVNYELGAGRNYDIDDAWAKRLIASGAAMECEPGTKGLKFIVPPNPNEVEAEARAEADEETERRKAAQAPATAKLPAGLRNASLSPSKDRK